MRIRMQKNALQLLGISCFAYLSVRLILTSIVDDVSLVSLEEDNIGALDRYEYSKEVSPFSEFDPEQSKMVVVLTYQRCGSTFFGNLFNTNPDVFYLYEPLDSLYSALYGTAEGWNVPSDITSLWNGSIRVLPQKEVNAVSIFLRQLLSCKLNNLPTETLIHKYWFMFAGDHQQLRPYIKCIRENNITYTKCQDFTPGYCGKRFGQAEPRRLDECNRYLWHKDFRESSTHPIRRNFTGYKSCLNKLRSTVESNCIDMFADACESKLLRSAKTVRATMDSMETLLRDIPNFRVIHLFRDPRGAILSRKEFDTSARGHYSQGPELMAREAMLYCRTVIRDVKVRKKLEEMYPGKIYPILYDDFVKDPMSYTENIYKFLNTTINKRTLSWIVENTSKKKNSANIAARWQEALTFNKYKDIMYNCKEFFEEIKYDWLVA